MKLKNKALAGFLVVTLPFSVITPASANDNDSTQSGAQSSTKGIAKAGSSKDKKAGSSLFGKTETGTIVSRLVDDCRAELIAKGEITVAEHEFEPKTLSASEQVKVDNCVAAKEKDETALNVAFTKECVASLAADNKIIVGVNEYGTVVTTVSAEDQAKIDACIKEEKAAYEKELKAKKEEEDKQLIPGSSNNKFKSVSSTNDNDNNDSLKKVGLIAAVALALGGLAWAFTSGALAKFLPFLPAPAPAPAPAPKADPAPAPAPAPVHSKGIAKK